MTRILGFEACACTGFGDKVKRKMEVPSAAATLCKRMKSDIFTSLSRRPGEQQADLRLEYFTGFAIFFLECRLKNFGVERLQTHLWF
jgi:hypothetical protein